MLGRVLVSLRGPLCVAACLLGPWSCSSSEDDTAAPASAASSTASAGGGGSGGATLEEVCNNGFDDDADGQIDCADTDCVDWACTAALPEGWLGPMTVYQGASPAPPCPEDQIDGFNGFAGELVFSPAECACRCVGLVECSSDVPTADLFEDAACSASCASAPPLSANGCVPLAGVGTCSAIAGITASGGPQVIADACAPSQTVTKDTPAWTEVARGCVSLRPAGGCSDAEVCAPSSAELPTCIAFMGDVECPGGPYSERRVLYGPAMEDTRDCSECTCAAGCSFRIDGHDTSDCTTAVPEMYPDGACAAATNPAALEYVPLGGGCATEPGTPTGTVTASKPATFCCMPR